MFLLKPSMKLVKINFADASGFAEMTSFIPHGATVKHNERLMKGLSMEQVLLAQKFSDKQISEEEMKNLDVSFISNEQAAKTAKLLGCIKRVSIEGQELPIDESLFDQITSKDYQLLQDHLSNLEKEEKEVLKEPTKSMPEEEKKS